MTEAPARQDHMTMKVPLYEDVAALAGAAPRQDRAPEDERRLCEVITSFPEVTGVLRLLTMHLGPGEVLVNDEIHVVDGLDTDQIEDLLERIL